MEHPIAGLRDSSIGCPSYDAGPSHEMRNETPLKNSEGPVFARQPKTHLEEKASLIVQSLGGMRG